MNINRDKHNKYVAGWTPNITTSTGSETSSGSTSTIIYVGGGGSSSGGDSGTVTQQNTFLYYIMSDGTNSITQTATIPTDTAILTLIGKNGVTVTASQEKSIPETEFVSTGTNTGTYKISYNKLVTTPDPTEEVPKPQPVTTYPVTITYVSGDKILTSSFDTLTLYNTVDETEQVVATYSQTQLQIDGDTTGINSIVVDANNTVFSRITLSITVEEQTTTVLDFTVTVNQQDILYVEGTQTEQYWKLDDDGNLYTTYNTYSTQELSAYGIGESEGTPTTGAEYLYQLRDVSDAVQTPIDKGILQYNAATSQWEVTDGSNITPDLTGYAKEDWVTQQITNQINILKGNAPENMDTLGEIAGVISSLSDRVTSLEVLLEWFEWDDTNDAIKALFDLYGVGEISAYGYNTQEQPAGAQYLNDLLDVTVSNPTNNQILIYNGSQWVNQVLPESGLNESELAQYLTEHNYVQSSALSQYATITYVDGQVTTINNRITTLVGDAPEDLDTLGEIATVIQSLEQLLDWFSFVDGRIRANYDLWSVGEVSAYGYNDQEQTIVNYLKDLKDVNVENAVSGQILVYNGSIWVSQDIPDTGLNEEQLAEYLTNNNYIQTSDLANYATQQWTNNQIQNSITALVGTAPDNLDTLGEIADQIIALQQLLDWFSFVDGKIRANYDLWGVGEITAYGVGEPSTITGILDDLSDVTITSVQNGQILQYNSATKQWVNVDLPETGLNEQELADYLVNHNYITRSDLNDYVTQTQYNQLQNIVNQHSSAITDIEGNILTINQDIDNIEDKLADLLDWFSWDNGKVRVNYTFYGVDEISAYGYNSSEGSTTAFLRELDDVQLTYLSDNQLLMYDASIEKWINIDKDQVGLNETELANYLTQNNYLQQGDVTWSNLSGKPSTFNTTINQINDLNSSWDSLLLNPPTDYVTRWPAFSEIADKPTTLAGYGITDAYTISQIDSLFSNVYKKKTDNIVTISKTVSTLTATNNDENAWNRPSNSSFFISNSNNALSIYVGGTMNERAVNIQSGHSSYSYASNVGKLYLNKLGGNVFVGSPSEIAKLNVEGGLYASSYIQIGSGRIRWDNTNNALYIEKSDGTSINFYSKAEISAYGFNSGSISSHNYLHELEDVNIDVSELEVNDMLIYDGNYWIKKAMSDIIPTITWDNISGKPSWIGSTKPSYSWNEITNKPSWIGSSKPIYTWSEIQSKPNWLTATIGSVNTPIYFNQGTPVVCSYSFGNESGNAAINNGTLNVNLNADKLDGYDYSSFYIRKYENVITVAKALTDIDATANSSNAWNNANNTTFFISNTNNAFAIYVDGIINGRAVNLQAGHSSPSYANILGDIYLNRLGGNIIVGNTAVIAKLNVEEGIYTTTYIRIGSAKLTYDSSKNILMLTDTNGDAMNFAASGEVSAYGINNEGEDQSHSYLHELEDVQLSSVPPSENDLLVFSDGYWRNISMNDIIPTWDNISGKPSIFPTNLASINDLYSSWDSILKSAPTAYITRWPTIEEIGTDNRYIRKYIGVITDVNADFNDYLSSGLYSVSLSTIGNTTNFPTNSSYGYGILANLITTNNTGIQWYVPDYNNTMAVRVAWSSSRWNAWHYLITNRNYTTYTVSKTGAGASGTWNINITGNSATATKLQTIRTISITGAVTGSTTFDGSSSVTINAAFNAQSLLASLKTVDGNGSGLDSDLLDGYEATDFYRKKIANVVSVSKALSDLVTENGSADAWNAPANSSLFLTNNNNALSFYVGGTQNERTANIQVGHSNATYYADILGTLYLNRLGGNVMIGEPSAIAKLNVDGGIYTDSYIQVGSARLRYDSANNAIYVQKSDGSVCNFYSTGEVSAYGIGSSTTLSGFLNDLEDVTIDNVSTGQALIYNGSQWTNQTIQQGLDEEELQRYLDNKGYIPSDATTNIGTAGKLAYYSGASTIDEYTSTVGSNTEFIYLNAGVPTVSNSTIGSTNSPVYINNGTFTPVSYDLNANLQAGVTGRLAYYSGTNTVGNYSVTAGSTYTPIYLNAGVPSTSSTFRVRALSGVYTGAGGIEYPSYFANYGLAVNMMSIPATYCDVIYVNGYNNAGIDVPYINAIAFQKTANTHGEVYHARGDYNGDSWGTWYKFVDSYNYTSIITKLGTSTIGSINNPIYLNNGVPTAITYNLNGNLNAGTAGKLAYYSTNNSIDDYTSTIGSGIKLWYLSSGVPTNSSSTVGSSTSPVYLSSGTITACTYDLSANVNSGTSSRLAYYSSATAIDDYTSTVGSNTRLWYLSSGTPTVSTSTIGSSSQPVYLSNGTITVTTASFLTTSNYTSTLDSRYVNVSGDTMTGNLTVPNININSTITLSSDATIKDNGGKGIYFSYAGVNDKCFLLDETSIRRGANAASMTLGTSTYRWYNVYSQYGNFSSAVTMSSTLKVNQYIELGSCRLKWDSTNNALYIEKSDGTAASFYATGEVSAYGMGSGGPANVDSITFTPGVGNRNILLSANGMRIITASSSGWGAGITVYNNANTTKLGDVCGAYGGQNSFTYSYFGGPYNSPGMTILANKNVGIGTTSPTYKLHVSGTAYATGGFQNGSDIRYKDVVQDIFLSVTDIANAPSFTFTWKNDQTKRVQCGTSAQYWQKILPQVIMSTNNQLSMSYDKAALISVISVAKEVETLEQRVSELERENAMLKQRLSDNNKIRTN